jgi:hypothetical protein
MGGPSDHAPSKAVDKLLATAEASVKRMASQASRVLVVVNVDDEANLERRWNQTRNLAKVQFRKVTSTAAELREQITWANVVAVFAEDTADIQQLDGVVAICGQMQRVGVYVKGKTNVRIPPQVSSFRWRAMSWEEFIALMAPGG